MIDLKNFYHERPQTNTNNKRKSEFVMFVWFVVEF